MSTGNPKTHWSGNPVNVERTRPTAEIGLAVQWSDSPSELLSTPATKFRSVRSFPENAAEVETDRLYCGDNLGALALLLKDKSVAGKVMLAYIDPPYATNSIFQSRTHRNAYTDILLGARYLEFLRARLILLRELLAKTGSIYVHLDDNMAFHAKVLMDEIFGRKNFRNFIVRRKCSSKNYTHKTYGNVADYILFYSKSPNFTWNRPATKWSVEHAEKEYPYIDEETGRRFKKVPLHAPGVRRGETGKEWRGMLPPPGRHWKTSPAQLEELDGAGHIYWSVNGNPRKKVYLEDSNGVAVNDIWLDSRDAHNQNIKITGYPTEKNYEMMERIVAASSNSGDLVLDCFCGSGTTLAAAGALGRRWIGVDNSQDAISATLERLLHGPQFMKVGRRAATQIPFPLENMLEMRFTVFATDDMAPELASTIAEWSARQPRARPKPRR